MVHIVSVTVYSLLGALQVVPSLRRGRPSWHRIAGRILVPAGVLVAVSGLWMRAFYPRRVAAGGGVIAQYFVDSKPRNSSKSASDTFAGARPLWQVGADPAALPRVDR
jgi:hypothetical protein